MNNQPGTSKFSHFMTKFKRTKSKGSAESIQMSDFKLYEHDIYDDFGHLNYHREWLPRLNIPDSKKSDLDICGLLHFQGPNALRDDVDTVSCKATLTTTCPETDPPVLEPKERDPHLHVIDSCYYGPGAEQNDTQFPISTITSTVEGKMADDCKASNQSDKTPKYRKNAMSKIIKNLSFSRKQHKGLNHLITSDSEVQESSQDESSKTTHVTISYVPHAQPDSSRKEYYDATPKPSPVVSFDEPPDQSLLAKQHRLMRRLHSTLSEATSIVGEFILLQKRED